VDLFEELDLAPQDAMISRRPPSRAQRDAIAKKQREAKLRMDEADLPRNVDCGPCLGAGCPTVLDAVGPHCLMCEAALGRARAT
jgi:hypothetical protein